MLLLVLAFSIVESKESVITDISKSLAKIEEKIRSRHLLMTGPVDGAETRMRASCIGDSWKVTVQAENEKFRGELSVFSRGGQFSKVRRSLEVPSKIKSSQASLSAYGSLETDDGKHVKLLLDGYRRFAMAPYSVGTVRLVDILSMEEMRLVSDAVTANGIRSLVIEYTGKENHLPDMTFKKVSVDLDTKNYYSIIRAQEYHPNLINEYGRWGERNIESIIENLSGVEGKDAISFRVKLLSQKKSSVNLICTQLPTTPDPYEFTLASEGLPDPGSPTNEWWLVDRLWTIGLSLGLGLLGLWLFWIARRSAG